MNIFVYKNICIRVFIPALDITVKTRNNPNVSPTREYIDNLWYSLKMKHYSSREEETTVLPDNMN